ncbi:MAG: carbohydrate ABC transporter substrate-binding protein [Actinobacteria bacterium]|nr:carbohydrate ABC transporter substrate-binding protein [Actinomycetota bacterium]
MTRRIRGRAAALTLIGALALIAAGCGGDDGGSSGDGGDVSGTLAVTAIWSGAEQEAFQAVIDGFTEANSGVTVNYTSGGDQLPTQLSTAVEGGNPPDIAFLGQPGLVRDFVEKDALQPLDFAREDVETNLGDSAVQLGSVDDTLYGFLFKAANKSLVWYNVAAFEDAGVEPPGTWDDFLAAADTIGASGIPAFSIGGADGWTLTDLFENIYLRTAGPEKYDQLAAHEIPWTDQSVKDALTEMAKVVGNGDNIAGGTTGALQTDFPTSVSNVFSESPKAAQVIEGDFVPGAVESGLEPETDYNVFDFPAINDSAPSVVGGGDTVVMFKDSPAAQAFIRYLTTVEAAEIWAERGGFGSLNQDLDTGTYPDAIQQTAAGALSEAEVFRFDLSDLQPAAFGGTVGQGLFKLFQDFVQNPDDVDGITQQMEDAAAKAFG